MLRVLAIGRAERAAAEAQAARQLRWRERRRQWLRAQGGWFWHRGALREGAMEAAAVTKAAVAAGAATEASAGGGLGEEDKHGVHQEWQGLRWHGGSSEIKKFIIGSAPLGGQLALKHTRRAFCACPGLPAQPA